MGSDKNAKHKASMEKQKANVDHGIASADIEQGVAVLLTGDGKGKSSSAFGMVLRSLGYGHKVGIIQFIKGVQLSGEEIFIRDHHPEVYLYQMGTGLLGIPKTEAVILQPRKRPGHTRKNCSPTTVTDW